MRYDVFETLRSKAIVLENGLKYCVGDLIRGKCQLMIWQPKAKKPYYNFLVTQDAISKILIDHKERLDSWLKIKEDRKNENKATPEKLEAVKAGDIFRCSWGWEQTNVDFYKVIARKGRKVTVRQLCSKIESTDSWASGKKIPTDDFAGDEQTFNITFRLNEPQFKISSFETASRWNGKPSYYSEWA